MKYEFPTAWENVKQIESGVKAFPVLVRFKLFNKTMFCAVDDKGRHWIRKSPLTLMLLTGCSAAKMKEIQK